MVNAYFLPLFSYSMWPMGDNNDGDNDFDDELMSELMSDPELNKLITHFVGKLKENPNIQPEDIFQQLMSDPEISEAAQSLAKNPIKMILFMSIFQKFLMSKGMINPQQNQIVISTTRTEFKSSTNQQVPEITVNKLFQKIFQEVYEKNLDCRSVTNSVLSLCVLKMKAKISDLLSKNPLMKQSESFKEYSNSIIKIDENTINAMSKFLKEYPESAEELTPIIKELQETINNTQKSLEVQKTITKKKLILKNFLSNYSASPTVISLFDSINDVSDLFMQFGKIKLITDDLSKSFNLVQEVANKQITPTKGSKTTPKPKK